ncbi:MAG: hypothetical protein EA426_01735 [Spirochaetaceae bacterium]|nr:MAG: hypothetical protein EA426_01735 [Spirochaetaceae bacterium]
MNTRCRAIIRSVKSETRAEHGFDGERAARNLQKTFELIETLKELNIAGDRDQNPGIDRRELERRFHRRMRARKDRSWADTGIYVKLIAGRG